KESKESFCKARAIENSIGFPFTHYTTGMISVISAVTGDQESHLRYSMESVQTVDATKDSIALAYFYANRSIADLKRPSGFSDGYELGMKSLEEFKKNGGDPA